MFLLCIWEWVITKKNILGLLLAACVQFGGGALRFLTWFIPKVTLKISKYLLLEKYAKYYVQCGSFTSLHQGVESQ